MKALPLLLLTCLLSLSAAAQHSLTVTFSGLESRKGDVLFSLRDENGEPVKEIIVPIPNSGVVKYTVSNLPSGTYTAACFHDENQNKELDKGMFGIPTEDYGFSNNARGTMGPPDLEDQRFTIAGDVTMDIRLE
ncbi:MAG: DUF2141 domain-containing protein [Bacteroidetes bacterium]|nr:MAG: DUF2141 domain-containing protein [Bacteroidota bacterium]